uniref:uncharacterized protein LOC125908408 n=1 Tax=Anopheles coluzzii TaxID=1518534 RepID=UPI0020FF8684|nr:uncharacterized protein LOC125908408 [Anopheles coluzzii]
MLLGLFLNASPTQGRTKRFGSLSGTQLDMRNREGMILLSCSRVHSNAEAMENFGQLPAAARWQAEISCRTTATLVKGLGGTCIISLCTRLHTSHGSDSRSEDRAPCKCCGGGCAERTSVCAVA